jgi:hypothetical protein
MKKITLLFLLTVSFSYGQVLDQDFEAGLTLPAGWTNNDIQGGGEVWTFETAGEAIGFNDPNTIYYDDGLLAGNYAIFDSDGYGGSIPENAALESPAFDCSSLTLIELSFNHYFTAGYGGTGYIEVYDGTTWIEVASYTGAEQAASSFGLESLDVTTELTGVTNAQVRFRWVGDFAWGWAFDNVIVQEGPSCLVPDTFTAGIITDTSFELSWVDANAGTPTWEIEWGTDGFTQGTGTPVTGLATPTHTFMGLTPNTTYDFFIRTNCSGGDGDSEWVGPIGFRSLRDCTNSVAFPYSEDFVDETVLDCFEIEDADATSPTWSYNSGVNDLDGDGNDDSFMSIFPGSISETEKDEWLFSPKVDMTAGNDYTISVLYNAFDLNTTADESFELIVVDAQSSTATFQDVIGTYSSITQSGAFGDTGGNDLISQAYTASQSFSPSTDGTYYVAIRATSTGSPNLFMVLNLSIDETLLSLDELDLNTFKHFYNKDTNNLTLESSGLAFDTIELFNILGQQVINKSLSQTTETINLSALKDGIYLAKVTIEGRTKTVKILKQ